jgi:O-antigen/teichoic acid export membrane protein
LPRAIERDRVIGHEVPSPVKERQRSILARLSIGMSGQAFSRVVVAAYTILLVPLLIRAWGVDGYGQWIALTALASYMGLSNFGLVSTSANEMIIASGAGDIVRAQKTFQVSINLTLFGVLPVILLLVAVILAFPVDQLLRLSQISWRESAVIIACAAAALWFQTFRGLMVATLYAVGSYGFAYYLQGAMKLVELLGIGIAVSAYGGGQVSAAVLVAAVALIELLVVSVYARRSASWARIDLRAFDRAWIVSQARPAIGFMVANLATQGLMNQAPRVVLSALLGGQAVGVYAIYATAMRFVDQLLLTLVMPLEIEIAHSFGRGERNRIRRLIVFGTHISWVLFLGVALGLMLFGPAVFRVWTTGRIEFAYGLMGLFMCLSAANLQGRVSLHALSSVNRLYGPSFLILLVAAVSVGIGAMLTSAIGMPGMVIGGVAGELLTSVIAIVAVSMWLDAPVSATFRDLLSVRGSVGEFRSQVRTVWQRICGRSWRRRA